MAKTRPPTIDDLRREVAALREEADRREREGPAEIAAMRERADTIEAALADLEEVLDRNSSPPGTQHGTQSGTRMGATQQANPDGHERRIAGIIMASRKNDERPFLRWLGTESVGAWARRHKHALTGESLRRERVAAYLRRGRYEDGSLRRVVAPDWFREMVARESDGEVPCESWDEEWPSPLRETASKKPRKKPRKP